MRRSGKFIDGLALIALGFLLQALPNLIKIIG
jgi:hypothetical protein